MMRVRATINAPAGGPYLCTTYWQATVEDNAAATAASNAMAAFLGSIDGRWPQTFSWVIDANIAVIDPVTGVETGVLSGPVGNTGSGALTLFPLPTADQGHLTLNTAIVRFGRRVRGGIFIPGTTTADSGQDGRPLTAYINALALASAFLMDPTTVELVVWSRPTTVPTVRPGAAATVQSISVTNKFAVLRSRRD